MIRLLFSPLGGLHRRRWSSRLPSSLVPHDESERSTHRLARVVAIVAGIARSVAVRGGSAASGQADDGDHPVAAGPQRDGHITDVTAPLVSGAPRAMDISIPCAAIATLPADGGLVVSTLPVNGFETGKSGLFVRANKDTVVVAFRDSVAAVAPRSAVAAGACQHPAHLGRRGRRRRRLRRDPRRDRQAGAGEEARGRRDLHRLDGARAAWACRRASTSTPASSSLPPR